MLEQWIRWMLESVARRETSIPCISYLGLDDRQSFREVLALSPSRPPSAPLEVSF